MVRRRRSRSARREPAMLVPEEQPEPEEALEAALGRRRRKAPEPKQEPEPTRRRRRTRRAPKVETLPEPEPEVETLPDPEPKAEPPPKRKRVRRVVRTRKPKVEPEPVEETEPVEEKPAPKLRRRRARKPKPLPPELDAVHIERKALEEIAGLAGRKLPPEDLPRVPEEEEIEEEVEQPFTQRLTAEELVDAMLTILDDRRTLSLRKIGVDYVLYDSRSPPIKPVMVKHTMTQKAANFITFSPEYVEFIEYWRELTEEERIALAKEEGVTWKEHDNATVNHVHLTEAMKTARGIKKWKSEYIEKAARDNLMIHGIHAGE